MPMPDPVMVVCVDGPTRGRLRAVMSGTRFQIYDTPIITSVGIPDPYDLGPEALTYHVHRIPFLDFDIRIASMQIDANNINPYDIISCLFNESGRQATYRVNNEQTTARRQSKDSRITDQSYRRDHRHIR